MSIYHPTGLTVEIVGIESSTNGRSCEQHDVCGSILDDDVVVRLRKIQILNSLGREETAIAAYVVSDGIDQCRVGFLQRHCVTHAKAFDGVLAQVTEVYSITSDSPVKRKKCRHNVGCCLAAIISAIPTASGTISSNGGQEDDDALELGEDAVAIANEDKDPATAQRDPPQQKGTAKRKNNALTSTPAAVSTTPALPVAASPPVCAQHAKKK
jgi:hypothetical protein